ncbi:MULTISPECIES: hypothetical protein [Rhodopseudomonas]|uniref:hypothetical protein n=1 Tax=Rhodopseudomonas TaxID=1073 RepID=UPI001F2D9708|nr:MULTISPECIES: hypothetical protein [Rhodopseudomonas]MDF3810751.1 hypothetical protein [Rhodopseudomonas sp. BAL398]WOK20555.1 hypothetical protein RBJ75_13995 [Rhodopseudomonas sp. BAL398]
MSSGAPILAGGSDRARLDHDASGARLTVAPSAFTQGAGANEGSTPAATDAPPPAELASSLAFRATTLSIRGCAGRPRAMLTGDLANPGEEALCRRVAADVGTDVAGPRPEAILIILAHRRNTFRPAEKRGIEPGCRKDPREC